MKFSILAAISLLAYTAKAQLGEDDQGKKIIGHPPFKASIYYFLWLYAINNLAEIIF